MPFLPIAYKIISYCRVYPFPFYHFSLCVVAFYRCHFYRCLNYRLPFDTTQTAILLCTVCTEWLVIYRRRFRYKDVEQRGVNEQCELHAKQTARGGKYSRLSPSELSYDAISLAAVTHWRAVMESTTGLPVVKRKAARAEILRPIRCGPCLGIEWIGRRSARYFHATVQARGLLTSRRSWGSG